MTAAIPMTVAVEARRSTPVAVLALLRWPNALIAGGGVVLGAWWAGARLVLTRELAYAVLAAWLVTAAVNALNDAFDARIDEIAHPERPIPRGELSVAAAFTIGWSAYLAAGVIAQVVSAVVGLLVISALLAGAAYAVDLNRRGLVGNAVVAVVASLPFLVGAAAAGDASAGLPLFLVAIPLHLAREVTKDIADMAGDRGHRRSVALRWGARTASAIALLSVAAYAGVAMVAFAPAGARRLALLPSLLLATWAAAVAPERRAPLLLKLAMLLAMAALPLLR